MSIKSLRTYFSLMGGSQIQPQLPQRAQCWVIICTLEVRRNNSFHSYPWSPTFAWQFAEQPKCSPTSQLSFLSYLIHIHTYIRCNVLKECSDISERCIIYCYLLLLDDSAMRKNKRQRFGEERMAFGN